MLKNIKNIQLNPPLFLTIGFGILIFVGACLLSLGIFTRSGESIGFINALFTAASASCVTGLVVVNTAEFWNVGGQIIILILIQIGGLGIMTLATLFPMIMRKRIGLTSRQIIREQLNVESFSGIVKLLKYVIYFTLTCELIGALLLSTVFIPEYGLLDGVWKSIFHAISAFCNAGFDIIGSSIEPYKNNVIVNFTIMALITIGGLGFGVTSEILSRKGRKKYSTHTKLVLLTSAILTFGGGLIFFITEYTNTGTMAGEGFFAKGMQSLFQSVIARTAGFNSINLSAMRDTSAFFMILLMFAGGSPGSTAGGLKTTTVGVLFASTFSLIRGENKTILFNKRVPTDTILKSLALVIISSMLVMIISLILTVTENFAFIDVLFEVVSAYATVGVTRGLTPNLSTFGRILITLTMYAGRIGPLTMAFAFGKKRSKSRIDFPDANISVG